MYTVMKATDVSDRETWRHLDAHGGFGGMEDARRYDDLETACGVARVMWWEAATGERVFVSDADAGALIAEAGEDAEAVKTRQGQLIAKGE